MEGNPAVATTAEIAQSIDTAWMIANGTLVLLMQAGFALLEVGVVRHSFSAFTFLKAIGYIFASSLAFFIFGYAFSFGSGSSTASTSFIGLEYFALDRLPPADGAYFFFMWTMASTLCAIISVAMLERSTVGPYLIFSFILTAFVWPPVVHAVWSSEGFMSKYNPNISLPEGLIDFSGAGVVHLVAGLAAGISTYWVGARDGFLDDYGEPRRTPPTSYVHVGLGTFLL
jgi:ammonium transporter, Amt family